MLRSRTTGSAGSSDVTARTYRRRERRRGERRTHDDVHVARRRTQVERQLRIAEVQLGARLGIDAALLHVLEHADDREPDASAAGSNAPADRVAIRIEQFRECLIDHHHGGRSLHVAGRKAATGENGNAHRRDIVRRHVLVVVDVLRRRCRRALEAFEIGVVRVDLTHRRQPAHRGHGTARRGSRRAWR